MKQSNWLQRKIRERERNQLRVPQRQREARVQGVLHQPPKENDTLNKLLDAWETKEYGKPITK